MNFLKKLFGKAQEPEVEGKAQTLSFDEWASYINNNAEEMLPAAPSLLNLEQSYYRSSVVRAALDEIIGTLASFEVSAPVYVETLINNPNEWHDKRIFLAKVMIQYHCTGACFIWKRRIGRAVSELRVVPASNTIIKWNRNIDDPIKFFQFHINSQTFKVPPEDVIWIRDAHSSYDLGYSSRLESVWQHVRKDEALTMYQTDIFSNLAQASLVASTDKPVNKAKRRQIEEGLYGQVGARKRGGILIAPNGVRIERPGVLEDLDQKGLSADVESRICAVLNVPPIIIGLRAGLDKSSYSNYEEARKSFYDETISPLARLLGQSFTKGLIEEEGMSGEVVIEVPDLMVNEGEESTQGEEDEEEEESSEDKQE